MRSRKEKVDRRCPCNGPNARCTRCRCAGVGRPCTSCRPLRDCRCRNSSSHARPSSASPSSVPGPPGTSPSVTDGQATSAPTSAQVPPVLPTVFEPSPAPARCSMPLGVLHGPSSPPSLPSNETPDQLSSPHTTPSPASGPVLPSTDTILQVNLPTLQHVPKEVCNDWTGLLADISSDIVRYPSCMVKWQLLFMLPRCILASPVRGGRLH